MARSIDGVRNVPNWYDWSPRFNAVWDVFGNARTAVKYSINRYNYGAATTLAGSFNVMTVASRVMLWNDKNGNDYPDGSPGFVYNDQGIATGYGPGFCTTAMFAAAGNPCELNMQSLITTSTGAMFGTPAAEQEYQGYPRQYIFEQIFEVQHALTRRLSLTFSYTRGDYKDRVATVNLARQPGDYVPVTVFNPVDGTPVTKWSIKDAATQLRLDNNASNLTYLEPANLYRPKTLALEFRMRPFAGAQIFGGFTMQRFDYTSTCETSIEGALVNPNSLRHCDTWNLSSIDDHGLYDDRRTELNINGSTIPTLGYQGTGISMDSGGTMPFSKDFRVGISLPLPWYGINLGVSYLNNDEGGVTMAYSVTYTNTGFVPATCLGGATRYPTGNTNCVGAASTDQVIPGISRNHKIATQSIAASCPQVDNGGAGNCQPGGFIVQPGSYLAGVSGTSFSFNLLPGGPTTRNKRERLNQLDLKVSKTFRVNNLSILPTLEVGNLFNQDKITGYASANYAETGGNYNVPSLLLQSRIVGFGVQVRW
jgi:hypothetical protein